VTLNRFTHFDSALNDIGLWAANTEPAQKVIISVQMKNGKLIDRTSFKYNVNTYIWLAEKVLGSTFYFESKTI